MKKKLKIGLSKFVILFIVFQFSFKNYAAVIYVNSSAGGANNGSNWADAYIDLTDALAISTSGDIIWVAQGVYKPNTIVDFNASGGMDLRESTFILPDGVIILGGFDGTEVSAEERDWETNQTILSGDIDNNDINLDGNYIAESTDDISGSNAYHVVYTENVGNGTQIDGVIITAGSADINVPLNTMDPNLDGGGLFNRISLPSNSSDPAIYNTSFYGNYAESEGGAIYNTPGSVGGEVNLIINNCLFSRNKADNAGGAIYLGSFSSGNYIADVLNCKFEWNEAYRRGGAIYLLGDHSQIDSTIFNNNSVTVISPDMSTLPGSGGAASLVSSNAMFKACYFTGNSATGNPTGAYEGGGGGAVYASTNEPQTNTLGFSEPSFIGCGFYNNIANGNGSAWGGAIVHLNDGGVLKPEYVNCVFFGNQAQNTGGAVANFTRVISEPVGFTAALDPVFTNCTFAGNQATERGGALYNNGYVYMGSQVLESTLENSILWENIAGIEGSQIYTTGNNYVRFSLIQGSGGSGGSWDTDLGTDLGNNIDSYPDFINIADPDGADNLPATNDDGLRLGISSPAINAGNGGALGLTGITSDYIANNRISSIDVDMGAYERSGIIIPPKLKYFWLKEWIEFDPPCLRCPQPWSVYLINQFLEVPQFVWKEPAQLIIDEDFATISGVIINQKNPDIGFRVNLKLVKPQDWDSWSEQGGSYYAVTKEARKIAFREHKNWTFWKLSSESYFEGIGDLQGKVYVRQPRYAKTGFQIGKGANAWDSDYGIGGRLYYSGKLLFKKRAIYFNGFGSLNVDAIPCEEDCLPKNVKTPVELSLKSGSINIDSEQELSVPSNAEVQIYPIPAEGFLNVSMINYLPAKYQLKIYDISGREWVNSDYFPESGQKEISLLGVPSGLYFLKIISQENNSIIIQKFTVK